MKKLHFGCFNCPVQGWINTDVTPHIWIARIPGLPWLMHKLGVITDKRYIEHNLKKFNGIKYLNIVRPWPYSSEQFDAIFSSHVLEHLTLNGAKKCLAECYRCLAKGGVLRISVPDLDNLVEEYKANDSLDWAIRFFEANETREKNMHHFMYNFKSLESLLKSVGFVRVYRCEYKKGVCPDIKELDNRPDSLFVEAIKY